MRKSIISLLGAGTLVVAGVIFTGFGFLNFSSAYPEEGEYSSWLSKIDDSTKINSLMIPGSHDSGALYSIAELSGKCQDLDIAGQLNVGVRFFDLRLQLYNNELKVIHGVVDESLLFQDVLSSFSSFLKEHPEEFLLVSIKMEDESVNSKLSFEDALLGEISSGAASIWSSSTILPETVGEARGYIHQLSRYADSSIGLASYDGWQDPDGAEESNSFELGDYLYVQDHYRLTDASDKQDEILSTMAHSQDDDSRLHLNFLSGYLTSSFPPSYAPSIAKTINPWFISLLEDGKQAPGVYIADFVASDMCEAIIGGNYVA
ncbi:MAG: hypothetical protein Q4F15_02525 [Bacillota bacterium]|nr:hypothetical protein [Bacillota bacterium]